MRVAMLPDMCILPGWDQHGGFRRMAVQTVVHLALVIAAIPGEAIDRLIDLAEQRFDHPGIIHIVLGQRHRFDLATLRIGSKMQFAPGAPFGFAMRPDFPFTFAIDLQAGAIHHNIDVPAGFLRQDHAQVFAAPRQGGVVGNRQAHLQQVEDRSHKTFRRPVGQMKHTLHRQHDVDRLGAVLKLAATLLFSIILPTLFKILRQPNRDRSTLY